VGLVGNGFEKETKVMLNRESSFWRQSWYVKLLVTAELISHSTLGSSPEMVEKEVDPEKFQGIGEKRVEKKLY
jgi:hypothetical protein